MLAVVCVCARVSQWVGVLASVCVFFDYAIYVRYQLESTRTVFNVFRNWRIGLVSRHTAAHGPPSSAEI